MNIFDYDSYFFDCDGVILDSNEVKTKAFRDTLNFYNSNYTQEFLDYHISNNGISRENKFKYYFEKILKNPNITNTDLYLNKFHSFVMDGLKKSQLIDGFYKFIILLNNNKKKTFVISAGSKREIDCVFKLKKIDIFFNGIYGSDHSKIHHIREITKKNNFKKGVFFGDSKVDYLAALASNLDFIYVKQKSNWKNYDEFQFHNTINNFKDYI